MHDGKPCGRPLYDAEKCICHSEKEDKDVKLFQQELDKIFDDMEAGRYDLTGFTFPQKGYKLPRVYTKDTFLTKATFLADASFAHARFSREADFLRTRFFQVAFFDSACFAGKARFRYAEFLKKVGFTDVTFWGEADFHSATFSGYAGYRMATFSGEADFEYAKFSGETDFEYAKFSGITRFRSTLSEMEVYFSHSEVRKGSVVIFDGETLQKKKKEMFAAGADFTPCTFAEPKNVKFRKLSLEKCKFLETDVTEVQFVDVTWANKPKFFKWFPRDAVYDELSEEPDYKLIEQLYRRLQINYVNNYRYSEAGDFYIGEQEMVRKAKGKVGRYLSTNFLYKIISYYGESFTLPLFWLVFVLLLFPAILLWDGINLNPSVQNPVVVETVNYEWSWSPGDFLPAKGDYWEAFVANFSLIAYSRSDIGKYLPESHTRLIVTIESLIVIALVAFFLLALRRQYKRKTF